MNSEKKFMHKLYSPRTLCFFHNQYHEPNERRSSGSITDSPYLGFCGLGHISLLSLANSSKPVNYHGVCYISTAYPVWILDVAGGTH